MVFQFFELVLFRHCISFDFLCFEFGMWTGSVLYFEWAQGDIQWDICFLNSGIQDGVG